VYLLISFSYLLPTSCLFKQKISEKEIQRPAWSLALNIKKKHIIPSLSHLHHHLMASHHLGTNQWPTNLRMWQLYEEAVALAAQLLPSTHALKLDAEKAWETIFENILNGWKGVCSMHLYMAWLKFITFGMM